MGLLDSVDLPYVDNINGEVLLVVEESDFFS